MDQMGFSDTEYSAKRKQTRREKFLVEMDKVIPWPRLEKEDEPLYRKTGCRPPYPLSVILGLDHGGLIRAFAEVREGLTPEIEVAGTFDFLRGSVLVFDRGYGRTWHKQLTDRGLFWATRARKSMLHDVVNESVTD